MIITINGKTYSYSYGVLTDADPNANYALQRIEDLDSINSLVPNKSYNAVRDIFVPSIHNYLSKKFIRRINSG